MDDQRAVFAFLADPASHGLSEPVVRIDTHAACVFLAGADVYKVKRAVVTPFLDYSTLDRRRAACESEIEVNTSNAPDLYLGAVPLTRSGGRLSIGGSGETVEWAVHLRRFDEDATLDRLAERGEIGPGLVPDLARMMLAAHRRAPIRDGAAAAAAFQAQVADTLAELAGGGDIFPAAEVGALSTALRDALAAAGPLLLRRGEAGRVRRCHGDAHLGNIALIGGRPVLFDAIEFDDAIATSDILYDLAFLLMDLWERGLRQEANLLMNRYLWAAEDEAAEIEGLALMPLFLAHRAAIRAKVTAEFARVSAERGAAAADRARHYLGAALAFLVPATPLLVAVGGLSGSGKSTLAARLAPSLGRPPGAVHLRSDIERKRMFGVGEVERLPAKAYEPGVSPAVYERLRALAAAALAAGASVVVDAVHQREDERGEVAAIAEAAGAGFKGLWLDAPLGALRGRVAERQGDASDATPAVVEAQAGRDAGVIAWHRIDADQPIEATLHDARAAIAGKS